MAKSWAGELFGLRVDRIDSKHWSEVRSISSQPEPTGPVPDETVRVAHAAFPKGNVFIQMKDVLGMVYDDLSFSLLFAVRDRPAEMPWRLAPVTVMRFAERLSDRQAAVAARARIEWKFALGLKLPSSTSISWF